MIKVDLHLHSVASNKPAGFFSKRIGINESYTDPFKLYNTLKERGMTLFTITDHDTIDGCLEIAHLPNVFISEEITTFFPEDGCKVHVIAIDINEKIHQDIQKIRYNIYELVDYLQQNNIIHILAHPFYDMDGKLKPEHIEKFLLLFDNWEILNGTRSNLSSKLTKKITERYTKEDILNLADKYGFYKRKKDFISFVGGSDDHGGLDLGLGYTYVEEGNTLEDLKNAIKQGKTIPEGLHGSPKRLTHMVMKIAFEGAKRQYNLGNLNYIAEILFEKKNKNSSILDMIIGSNSAEDFVKSVIGANRYEAIKEDTHKKIYTFFDSLFPYIVKNIKEMKSFNLERFSQNLGMAILSFIPLSTYLITYWQRAMEKNKSKELYNALTGEYHNDGKVAYFTDTLFEINGVAKTSKKILELAQKENLNLQMIISYEDYPDDEYIKNFKPLISFNLPEYEEIKINIPNFLDVLEYIEKENFDVIYSATPGIMGIYGFIISKILGIPFVVAHHTDFPEYIKRYTNDHFAYQYTWKAFSFLYNNADKVLSPSNHYKNELIKNGVKSEKIKVFKRGVDLNKFNPSYKDPTFWENFDPTYRYEKIVLYVGRVAKEKDLDIFVEVAKRFENTKGIKFAIVGDGPYRKEIEGKANNIIFTGYLEGEELSKAYASSYLFLFPSTTETFGNVILEAMASGLPVLVSDKGAAKEHIISGMNGFIIENNNINEYVSIITGLMNNKELYENLQKSCISLIKNLDYEKSLLDMINEFSLGLIKKKEYILI
ncbi:glycosyltransferase [Venenivibrio stagnispumantis]|uniref:Glycosyltransferase involved in cell wall bisynthesis n=1 Tax=Venenivibrio stagnispumantis TaxID=407998 RepID=A0AA45WPK7_9AQUI|nr:glycosyltransferase [Venenivibrio stagnispumantis]MCW4572680.1 glycosyltransferase [Venenivibrio stagnispumantis]SMP21467.1 Glycosyltransferase involved in cell wall bisynthesis [Venenivibrio stagnispumantis]